MEHFCIAAYSLADELQHPIEPTAFACTLAFFLEELVAVVQQQQQHQRGQQEQGEAADAATALNSHSHIKHFDNGRKLSRGSYLYADSYASAGTRAC